MVEATVAAVAPDRWDSAVLGGVSLGGNLAVAVARQVGCRGLLVVSTTPLLGIPDALRARAEDVRRRGEVAHLAGGQIDRWLGPDSAHRTTQLAGELATMLSSVHPDHYANCCAIGAELDQTAELAALDVPTAWVAGTHDQATPLDRQAVAASLVPDAVFVPVVGHHMVPWTAPTAVAQAVADHLLYR
jgi:3-oxoadipate enol-lactonase